MHAFAFFTLQARPPLTRLTEQEQQCYDEYFFRERWARLGLWNECPPHLLSKVGVHHWNFSARGKHITKGLLA